MGCIRITRWRNTDTPSTTTVISATLVPPSSWTPPFYWVPPVREFPGIDSALVLENEIFAIHVIIANRRRSESPADGLSVLYKLLPDNLKNLYWSLVFVGTDEDWLERIAKEHAGKIFTRYGTFVDPGIVFRPDHPHFRDEADPPFVKASQLA
ncbi:hypothetical protein JVT61DRAFT_4900 [Boletus reticuloceps]|uniref:Uncharacterized protein n=1 Tax=Boletus reticuloceps TaxID=495285 RepID=A0A8I3AFK8_9AGAM|nr:hypothetical protein JVT61DRAFT_4900 [Boletus reticuloceps]